MNAENPMASSNHIRLEPEHLGPIKALADEFHRSVEEVNKVYSEAFVSLDSGARIKNYLIILVCKKVRDELRKPYVPGDVACNPHTNNMPQT